MTAKQVTPAHFTGVHVVGVYVAGVYVVGVYVANVCRTVYCEYNAVACLSIRGARVT